MGLKGCLAVFEPAITSLTDGLWPSAAVCDAMEVIASPHIGIGFGVDLYNSRGAVWRGEGGGQERGLATQHRTRAAELAIEYPYVSGVLEDIARSYDRDAHWQRIVEAHLRGQRMLRRNPMQRGFHFAAVRRVAAFGRRIVGAT